MSSAGENVPSVLYPLEPWVALRWAIFCAFSTGHDGVSLATTGYAGDDGFADDDRFAGDNGRFAR